MSSPKRQLVCRTTSHDAATAVEPRPPSIPMDLLLEILARADVTTVVRCAATCKTVRRGILGDPTLVRRVAERALLLGVSYAITGHDDLTCYHDSKIRMSLAVGQAPRQRQTKQNHRFGFDAGCKKLRCLEPVASRGGLIALRLRRRHSSTYAFVWTADRQCSCIVFPPTNAAADYGFYPHALLAVGDAGRSFQLLVVSRSWPGPSSSSPPLRTQIYSSSEDKQQDTRVVGGWWGPVSEITDLPPDFPAVSVPRRRPEALVLGGSSGSSTTAVVHWLHSGTDSSGQHRRCIIRLEIGEAKKKATLLAVPPECADGWMYDGELQLAASTDGELSLVVAERSVISMWTLSSSSSRWARQVVVSMEAVGRAVPEDDGYYRETGDLFLGFGELSGTVVLLMHQVGLVRINLRTKQALVLLGSEDELMKETEAAVLEGDDRGRRKSIQACLHEVDLPSVLLAMKHY